jgi:hypothetical protein
MITSERLPGEAAVHTSTIDQVSQINSVLDVLKSLLADTLFAVYLHGSAVITGLRPHSDIDLLAIVGEPIADPQRRQLLSALLGISGRYPAIPGGPRCIELIVIQKTELTAGSPAPRSEFVYGEWLRSAFEAGAIPKTEADPDLVLILAQAARTSVALFGPGANSTLPQILPHQILGAIHDMLPTLLADLVGDERNVLLTLARMWRTAATGDFVSKDAAAKWASVRMPAEEASVLCAAHDEYLGITDVSWGILQPAVQRTARFLVNRLLELR